MARSICAKKPQKALGRLGLGRSKRMPSLSLLFLSLVLLQPSTSSAFDKLSKEAKGLSQAQQAKVTGRVVDDKGSPIPGASITNKSTGKVLGLTAEDGTFSVSVDEGDILVISSVGFGSQEIKVSEGSAALEITLNASESSLDDVVTIGYGQSSKRLNINSISSVPMDKMLNRPSGSIESLLQGLVPGLLVQNSSGMPGGRSNIQVRGLANFSSSANSNVVSTPLFIIDGVPQEQDAFDPSNPRQAIASVLGGLNPFDLESIDVLKDAAATAIYGSRGANGVIIITTKRGKVGKPIVAVNAQYGGSTYPELRKTYGGAAERDFKIALYNQYKASKVGGGFTSMPIELTDSLNTYYNNSTDWQKLYFKSANISDINVSVSGANENASYRLGADYYNEGGIVLGSGYKRYSMTYSGVFTPTKGLTITGQANLSQQDASKRRGDNYNAAVVGNNFSSSFLPGPNSGYFDRYLESYNKGVNEDLTRTVIARLEASYDLTDFLNITSSGSANYKFYRTRDFQPSATQQDNKSAASYYSEETVNLLSETFIRLHHKFDLHNVDFLLGNTINTSKNNNIFGGATGGPSDVQQVIQGYPQNNLSLVTHNTSYGLLSYYSRLSYDYDQKYLFQGVLRADASSKFGKNKQWGYFPSASLGWILSSENFFKDNVGAWFSFAKIRASAGVSGEQYQDAYLAFGAYQSGNPNDPNGNNATYNGVPLLRPNYAGGNGIPLPDLTWEKSKDIGLGLELEFFQGRLSTTLEYYHKAKDGFLFNDPLNGTSGYASRFINSGAVENTGFDLSLTAYFMKPEKKFQYNLTFIGSANKNKLTKLPDLGRSVTRTGYSEGSPYLQVGKPLNGFYLLKYLGVFPDDAAVPVNPYTGAKLYPNGSGFISQDPYRGGDIRLLDQNGDGVIDIRGAADKVYMGDPNPKFYGSLSHNFGYRFKDGSNLQLNLFFNYSFGNKVYNKVLADRIKSVSWTASQNVNYPGGQTNLLDVSDLDFWTPQHTSAHFPALNPWRYYATSSYDFIGNYDVNTSLFLENGWFIRLNNINLSYDFSVEKLSKAKIRRVRVFAGLDNLFIIKEYTGVDPENVNDYGYDQGNGYPIPKKFNVGFNFEF